MKLACPNCQQSVILPDLFYGKQVTCPGCKKNFMAPQAPVAASGGAVEDDDGGGGAVIEEELAEADFGAGPVFSQGWRSGAGGTAGLLLDLTDSWRTLFEATYIGYAQSPAQERLRMQSAWRLSRDTELRLTLDRRVPDEEAGLSFYLYF